MTDPLRLEQVLPKGLAEAVSALPNWFVIGGQAVRCFCPYRPTQDVDFGVNNPRDLEAMLALLAKCGPLDILEKTAGAAHVTWKCVDVSIFVLELLKPHTEEHRLTVTGILATKLHAIVDRGVRRDFFDLYVMLQDRRLGIAECLSALRTVYSQPVPETLLLRALTFFDDADREAALPGEGREDWTMVKDYFLTQVGNMLVPPGRRLSIQDRRVDVLPA